MNPIRFRKKRNPNLDLFQGVGHGHIAHHNLPTGRQVGISIVCVPGVEGI